MSNTGLTIEHCETFLLDVPTIRPHIMSVATMHKQSMVLLRLRFSDGSHGWGEATTIGGLSYGEESPESIKLTLDTYIAPLLVHRAFISVGETMQFIRRHIVGNRFAKCALETALLDALGHRLGVPISELLGGRVTDRIPVLWVLASGDQDTDIAEAHRMIESGRHNTFKIKIGKRSVVDDVAHVAAIKRAIGEQGSVRVDVNQAWTRAQAQQGAAMLADAGIDLIEQPLPYNDLIGMQQLSQQANITIMADESVQGSKVTFDMASASAADCYSIKIAQSGGLSEAANVAHIATTSGASLYGGTMLESPIGTIASAQLFSTFEQLEWGTELFAPLLLTDSFINETLDYSNFELAIPSGAGLGLSIDEDKLAYFNRS